MDDFPESVPAAGFVKASGSATSRLPIRGSPLVGVGSGLSESVEPDGETCMPPRAWSVGDRVRHAGRPEWGGGRVNKAESVLHEGKRCQRLTIQFERAGVKTLSTAFAELEPVGVSLAVSSMTTKPEVNDAFLPPEENLGEVLARLPDPATDPFRNLEARLKATLGLYRFQPTGASLLDWAAMQTGMVDPLSKCSRQELEAGFQRFRVRLDSHLVSLAKDAARADPALLTRLKADAPSQARTALDRLNGRR